MHAAAINLRGGVSPRGIRLRGQSIIEYVLIIAVIGLVIVFAGPGVAGAIRNQFNLVGNTLNSGTNGGTEGGGASGGGSTGADSATVQAAIAKDAKDWTLGEQKAVAEDIASKGEASPAYAKAKAAMDAGTKFSMKLTNGEMMQYRIIGISHDLIANPLTHDNVHDTAGLTFLAIPMRGFERAMNATDTNTGGWEKSELRKEVNSGDIWNLMPNDFQSKVKTVRKFTHTDGDDTGDNNTVNTETSDKLFLLSYCEIVNTNRNDPEGEFLVRSEGRQYEVFEDMEENNMSLEDYLGVGSDEAWADRIWERTTAPGTRDEFLCFLSDGNADASTTASAKCFVCPAWCF